jgi:dihydrofolate reductase
MGKIICNLAMSLDGFIADEKGGVDWLNDYPPSGEDYGMTAFFQSCGAAIMGSKTYEQAVSFNSWFGDMEGYVFTSRELKPFKNVVIKFFSGNIAPVVVELKKKQKDSWLVGGAMLIADFINRKLLDELIVTVIPKILGKGMPLCPGINEIKKLELLESKQFKDGVIQLKYKL